MTQEVLELLIRLKDEASAGLAGLQERLGGVGDVLGSVGAVAGGAALAGVLAFGAGVAGGVADAREAAQIMAQTEAVIRSTGGAAGVTAQQVADMAGSLSAAAGQSLFGDSDIQKGQNLLLTFTNIKEVLPDTTQIMVDMAQAMGTDVSGGAIQLGKALNDPINGISALSRVGVTFTDEQKEQIKTMQEAGDMAGAQRVILAELNKEFGGSAKAAADADGGMAQFNDRMGELFESIGGLLLPVMTDFFGFLNDQVMPVIEDQVLPAIQELGAVVIPMLAEAWADLAPYLQEAARIFVDDILPVLQAVWSFLSTYIFPIIGALANILITVLGKELQALAGLFQNVIMPALSAFWSFIDQYILPIFDKWTGGFEGITKRLQELKGFLDGLGSGLTNLQLPSWLTPGSPTPFELGLAGIGDELRDLAGAELPRFRAGLDLIEPAIGPIAAGDAGGRGAAAGATTISINTLLVNVDGPIADGRDLYGKIRDEALRDAQRNVTAGID